LPSYRLPLKEVSIMRGLHRSRLLGVALCAGVLVAQPLTLSLQVLHAQGATDQRRIESVRQSLQRLPNYSVFDVIAFRVDRATVVLTGFVYSPNLRKDAEQAAKWAYGIDTVDNQLEELSASVNDERIRKATFASIYTDDFLSRYAPGGPLRAQAEAAEPERFAGMRFLGTYPIHIVVNGGRTTLIGAVGNASDRQLAEARAREVTGVFKVENELVVSRR
jgi:osmotically-inducible protein OsmY